MGKKSTPQAPAAPDPVATTQAQAAANKDAAITQANLNRIDQYTPQGSITYAQNGVNADGTPKYAQTQTYSPGQQALYDQQNQIAQSLGGVASSNIARVQQAQSQPFNFDGMTPLQTGAQQGQLQYGTNNPQAQTGVAPAGGVQTTFGTGPAVQNTFQSGGNIASNVQQGNIRDSFNTGGNVQQNIAGAGQIGNAIQGAGSIANGVNATGVQQNLNFNALPNINQNFDQTAKAARDASYQQAASRLDPQYSQMESDLSARLANSGISQNSDAYRREMDNFGRQRADAYNQANFSAQDAGMRAQQQGYGQSLASRQQGAQETSTAGNFANNAAGQIFGMGVTNVGLNNNAQQQQFAQNAAQLSAQNSAQQQQFAQNAASGEFTNNAQNQQYQQNMSAAQFGNTAQGQIFGMGMQNAGLNNSAQQQQYQQNIGAAQFNNDAAGQQYQQNMGAAQFGNNAQDQQYQQNLSNAGFYNQAQSQNFNQAQQNAAMNNTAQGQQFNQSLANAQLNNNSRQQQIDEASYLRNLPLNDIAALLGTGGGVQNPNFSNFAQVGVAAPDYQGAVYANYNAQNQQYQAAQQARSQGLGSIFGMLGSVGGAIAMSDRRLKTAIKPIGVLANGLRTYAFNYIGDSVRRFGVMAQEVLKVVPDAVIVMSNGYMAVDYRKVM